LTSLSWEAPMMTMMTSRIASAAGAERMYTASSALAPRVAVSGVAASSVALSSR
jgi:hypothetical protein